MVARPIRMEAKAASAEIARLVTAPRHLNISLSQPSPDRKYFLKEQSEGLPSVTSFGILNGKRGDAL